MGENGVSTFLGCLLTWNIQNISMTILAGSQVSDHCPLGYLLLKLTVALNYFLRLSMLTVAKLWDRTRMEKFGFAVLKCLVGTSIDPLKLRQPY